MRSSPAYPAYLHQDSPPLVWATQNDAISNYSVVFPFEKWLLDRVQWGEWVAERWSISLWAFGLYVACVYGGQKLMSYRSRPYDLRTACVVWNTAAALFSVMGFARTSQELFRVVSRHGLTHSVCVASYIQDAVFCFWIFAFIVSKFVEFVDTAFLILRKRPVIFLHWYHHGTVLVFCWHGASTLTAAGRWFCWMNYGVHSAIYTYFALRTAGLSCPKWVSMCVTSVQMSQMVVGCWIGYVVYTVKAAGGHCHHTWSNLYMALGIYSTFFILFMHYFYRAYLRPTKLIKRESRSEESHQPMSTVFHSGADLKQRVRVRQGQSESG